ncbi:MAG: Holliday junction branch migration protein RuvA [Bacteroidales bacterium]|jgi:Holliday junction DNA helicase RuvA|nr:Holliday junction branch migration protein RuvA [Bacteroidales bacterium]HOA10742.1 Holliday junction branch migration protein RuvA [Tenuifilaceae bacterium]MBP8642990.1 Holliday junction branch migration protein RuvA [Bacteroidales bacterium]NLI88491.1 Holliday junction branch migration protein RuvA [Bacteroidales bacterium]HOC35989.1 Holliday junction branch migration protein RuvA [Tenuifilaceae bacterium]
MYDYIVGKLAELTPTHAVVEVGGLGYHVNISLQTYSAINGMNEVKLYLHQVIREDAHLLYGFFEAKEREIFRLLISVSGVGASTARLILSSLNADELQAAILTENINLIKQVKGIGLKTAQRIVVDLKDKVVGDDFASKQIMPAAHNTSRDEALSALVMLGFSKSATEKVLDQIIREGGELTVEGLIKSALKRL